MIKDGKKQTLNLPYEDDLTDIQKRILLHYWETFSITKACDFANVDRAYIYNARRFPNSTFNKALDEVTKMLEDDDRVGKVGTLEALLDIERRAKAAGDFSVEIKVRQEINKMIERNLAVKKRTTENINIDVQGRLDLTQPKELGQGDINYEDLNYAEDEEG